MSINDCVRLCLLDSQYNSEVSYPLIIAGEGSFVAPAIPLQQINSTVIRFLLLADKALKSFEERQFKLFDPLLGTCACHLTALKMVASATLLLEGEGKELFQQSRKTVENAISSLKNEKCSGKIAPEACLEEIKQRSVPLKQPIIDIIYAYTLTLTKKCQKIREPMNCLKCSELMKIDLYTEVTEEGGLRKELATDRQGPKNLLPLANVVKRIKAMMSQSLTGWLQNVAGSLGNETATKMLQLNTRQINGCSQAPDFYSMEVVVESCLQKQIPILLKFKRCDHSYLSRDYRNDFEPLGLLLRGREGRFAAVVPSLEPPDKPLLVFEAKRGDSSLSIEEVVDKVMEVGLLRLCARDAAQHPPYAGLAGLSQEIDYSGFPEEKERVKALKEEAEREGCCLNDHSLFLLTHIYCNTLENELETLGGSFELYTQEKTEAAR